MKIEQLFVAFCVMSIPLYAEASDATKQAQKQTPETPIIPASKTPRNKETTQSSRSPILAVQSTHTKTQPQNLDKPVGQYHKASTPTPSRKPEAKPNIRVTNSDKS